MCVFLYTLFLTSFLAGVLAGGAFGTTATVLAVGGANASVVAVWSGGVMGSLALIAAWIAWRLTSSACTATAPPEQAQQAQREDSPTQ